MTKTEIQSEALDRARNGQALTNYPAIFAGFMAKGIAEADIKPRENVLTFNAWKAIGRSVKKGEHGVKIVTFVDCSSKGRDTENGEQVDVTYRKSHTVTVFHVSQTEPTADRDARFADRPQRHPRSQWASGHGRYPPIDPDHVRDPGEDAADRWNETHGDRF